MLAAQEANAEALRQYPNVLGTATGSRQVKGRYTGEICLQVLVSRKYRADELSPDDVIPAEVPGPDGLPVRSDAIEVGAFLPAQIDSR